MKTSRYYRTHPNYMINNRSIVIFVIRFKSLTEGTWQNLNEENMREFILVCSESLHIIIALSLDRVPSVDIDFIIALQMMFLISFFFLHSLFLPCCPQQSCHHDVPDPLHGSLKTQVMKREIVIGKLAFSPGLSLHRL